MQLHDILSILKEIAEQHKLSEVWICGGIPRDKVMGRLDKIKDLDITTGDEGSFILGKEFAVRLNLPNQVMSDNHVQAHIGDFKVDFSSNFKTPGIENLLTKAGLTNPTDLQKEQFSRDFTCNSLLLSLDLKTIKDPTGLGIKDINKKILRTCLPARLTLGYDNKRVARILYLSSKLGFELDQEIVDWVKAHPSSIANADKAYVVKKLQRAFEADPENTVYLLDSLALWNEIPLGKDLIARWTQHIKGSYAKKEK